MLGWNIFPYVAGVVFVLALLGAVVALRSRNRSRVAIVMSVLAVVVMSAFVAALWLTLERPPLRTMGETRLWYSLFLLLAGVFTYVRWSYRWVLSFSTLMATVFMTINILRPELHDQTLMPALQSVWFVPHVTVYMFSYALLGCATLLSLYGLARPRADVGEAVERLIYGGVAFFSVGMLTGALWAKEAWGAYWSWDAKEAWAAVTWAIYLIALHLGAGRRRFYLCVVLGFVALQMCWWGISYLPSAADSVHAYN